MPRSRRRSMNVLSPNLTPLLDVVLQLITFFMMLVHFGSRLEGANRAVRLPVAPAALPGSDLTFDRLAVDLDAQGRLRVDGQVLEGSKRRPGGPSRPRPRQGRVLRLLGDRAAGGDELPTVVIVRADRDASYGTVRRTLAEAQEQGFAHFSLVVLRRRPAMSDGGHGHGHGQDRAPPRAATRGRRPIRRRAASAAALRRRRGIPARAARRGLLSR